MDPSLRSMRTVMRISSGRSVSLVVTANGCPQASACWGLVLSKEVKYKILKCRVSKAQLIFTLWNFYLYNAFPDLYRQKVLHPEPHSGLLENCHQYLGFLFLVFIKCLLNIYIHCTVLFWRLISLSRSSWISTTCYCHLNYADVDAVDPSH